MPATEEAWPTAFTPGSIGASCGGKSWGPTAMPMGSTFAARKTNGASSTQPPGARPAVIPNAAYVDYYKPRPTDPPPDGRTVLFFGLLSYAPNVDGVMHFVQKIWPRVVEAHPEARFKIIGGGPPRSLQLLAGPRVELTGFVPDLRPHLAAAAAVALPLRLGAGARPQAVEAM